jgi:hypothetical protein
MTAVEIVRDEANLHVAEKAVAPLARKILKGTERYRELTGGGGSRDWLANACDELVPVLADALLVAAAEHVGLGNHTTASVYREPSTGTGER